MKPEIIEKTTVAGAPKPNLADYEAGRARFSWESARAELAGLPGGGLNIAYETVDRHAAGARAQQIALRWLGRDDRRRDFTYADLRAMTCRFANVLTELRVSPGERVFFLSSRMP